MYYCKKDKDIWALLVIIDKIHKIYRCHYRESVSIEILLLCPIFISVVLYILKLKYGIN